MSQSATAKSYRQECIRRVLVKGEQELVKKDMDQTSGISRRSSTTHLRRLLSDGGVLAAGDPAFSTRASDMNAGTGYVARQDRPLS